MRLSRRQFLHRSAFVGCSAAASPLFAPVSFAAAPWDTRLVVIILRGGMDALDVVRPYGDGDFAALRPSLAGGLAGGLAAGAQDLDGFHGLHPALTPLLSLWQAGDLGFVQAVSTPYRDKRSHFDGQDLLEAGGVGLGDVRDGWLNRMLQQTGVQPPRRAFAVGQGEMTILNGAAPVSDWSPDADLVMSPQAERLAQLLMEDDLLFHAALSEALDLSRETLNFGDGEDDETDMMAESMQMTMPTASKGRAHVKVADFVAEQLRGETRVAALSLNGWDTHYAQERNLTRALQRLSDTILALQSGVGPDIWGKTAVLAVTEFGRTARENGTGGTDHGTGGTMLMAGGALRGGKVHGRWPGLAEADLYDRRDLMPTADVRGQMAWILRGLVGLDRHALEQVVFPGLDMGADPGLLR